MGFLVLPTTCSRRMGKKSVPNCMEGPRRCSPLVGEKFQTLKLPRFSRNMPNLCSGLTELRVGDG